MYCPKCGTENPDDAQLCHSCSWVLTSISTVAPNPNAKTSRLAITALVLAILSFFTFFITAIPALIFGIISLVKIEKSAGLLKGKGLAIAGLAFPAALAPFALMLAILMPALARARAIAQRKVCATNMSGLGKAMFIYADDNNNTLPIPSQWCDLLIENADVSEKSFLCAGVHEGPCNYAMNENIENIDENTPPDIVLLFETSPGWNQVGGPEILTIENHNGEGCNVLFADGYVEFVKKKDVNNIKWTTE